jgi:hypothetical protein
MWLSGSIRRTILALAGKAGKPGVSLMKHIAKPSPPLKLADSCERCSGKGIINPIAAISSAQLMLETLGEEFLISRSDIVLSGKNFPDNTCCWLLSGKIYLIIWNVGCCHGKYSVIIPVVGCYQGKFYLIIINGYTLQFYRANI